MVKPLIWSERLILKWSLSSDLHFSSRPLTAQGGDNPGFFTEASLSQPKLEEFKGLSLASRKRNCGVFIHTMEYYSAIKGPVCTHNHVDKL